MKKVLLILIMCVSSLVMFGGGEHFTPDKTGCESFTLKIHSVLCIDGVVQGTSSDFGDALELLAYDQQYGLIRGAKRPQWNPRLNAMYYFQTIYGYSGAQYTFKVYDNNSGELLPVEFQNVTVNGEIIDPIVWEGNGVIGVATDPNNVAYINFITPATEPYTLDIAGYGEGTGNWYLIASPVTVAPADVEGDPQGMTEGNFDLYYFDNSKEDEWINYKNEDGSVNSSFGNITPGKGYLYAREESTELQLSGELYEGEGQFDLAYSTGNPSADMRGWNLVGNPFLYGATIDKDAFYVMNEEGRNDIIVSTETAVAPMQGIFVLATGEGQTVKFTQALQPLDGKVVLNLNRNRGTVIDRAIVRLGEGGTLPKFMLNPENTKIYIEQGGDDYAMVSSNEDEIPVSFKAASNGTYTLNVAVQNAELDYLHLIDNMTGANTDLLVNPNYTFEAHTGDYACRFTLVLSSATGIDEHFAFYNGTNWTISNDGEAVLQVVDVMGRILNSKEICGNAEINISQPAGVYMLRLVNGSDVKVQKVIVR